MDHYLTFSAENNADLTIQEIDWLRAKYEEYLEYEDWCGDFQLDLSQNRIWIYAEEAGNPDTAAQFIQEWLAKFHPEDCFGFEWAHFGSRPAVDTTGGGAAFITAEKVDFTNTYEWLHQKRKEHQDAKAEDIEKNGGSVPGQRKILE